MKRFIVILLAIQLVFLTSCTFPFFGKSSEKPSELNEGQEMIKLPDVDSTNVIGNGISDSVPGDLTTKAGEAAPAMTAQTGVAGVSMGSTASSAATESTVAVNTAPPLTQENSITGTDLPPISVAANTSDTLDLFAETRRPVTVYYQDGDGYLVPMTRWILLQQGIARAAVSLSIDSAIAREEVAYYGIYPVIPEDTDILGIDIRNGIATIDFDRHLLNYSNEASERNIVASIVYTLTEFKTINKVRILINGYTQDILKYGTNISNALGRGDISINTNTSLLEVGTGKVDVFLLKKANEGFTYLVPVSVTDVNFDGELTEILVKQLLGKVASGSMYTEMPDDVNLLDCSTVYDVLTLDLSENFTSYGGNAREEGILKQLAYTVRQVEGIKSLRILVEGRKVELPEGTDISSGLKIPATINDVMDR